MTQSIPEICDHTVYRDLHFSGLVLSNRRLSGATFEDCVFDACQLASTKLVNCHFTACRFIASDLSSTTLGGSTFNDVSFEQCRLIGLNFTALNPLLLDVHFNACLLDYSIFSHLSLKKTRFINCRMKEADLSSATLNGATFTGSVLQGANLTGASLIGADLRETIGLSFDPAHVKLGRTQVDLSTLLAIGERLGLRTDLR